MTPRKPVLEQLSPEPRGLTSQARMFSSFCRPGELLKVPEQGHDLASGACISKIYLVTVDEKYWRQRKWTVRRSIRRAQDLNKR